MLYSLPPHNGHFLLSPRWPLWRGSTVLCIWSNELFLLPYFFSVLSMVRWAPDYANLYRSVQNDVFLGKNVIVGIFIILYFFSWLQHLLSRRRTARVKQRLVNLLWAQPSRWNMNISVFLCPCSCLLLDSSYLFPLTNVTESNKSFLYFVHRFLVLLLGSFNSLLTDASVSGIPRVGPWFSLVILFDLL